MQRSNTKITVLSTKQITQVGGGITNASPTYETNITLLDNVEFDPLFRIPTPHKPPKKK